MSHLLYIWSARSHKHPVHWKPHWLSTSSIHVLPDFRVKKVWSLSQHTLLASWKCHCCITELTQTDRQSLTLSVIPLGILLFWEETCTNKGRTYKVHIENIFSREGTCDWGGWGWLRPGTFPVSSRLDITRLNEGTQCPTPDTSDLCHLIRDASKWQRGKGAGWRCVGLLPEVSWFKSLSSGY